MSASLVLLAAMTPYPCHGLARAVALLPPGKERHKPSLTLGRLRLHVVRLQPVERSRTTVC